MNASDQRIWALVNQGLTTKEIQDVLESTATQQAISSRFAQIKRKLGGRVGESIWQYALRRKWEYANPTEPSTQDVSATGAGNGVSGGRAID